MSGEKPSYLKLLDTPTARSEAEKEEEARERWRERERKADAKLSEVAEQNQAIAFNLGFPDVHSYFKALDGPEGKTILKIAISQSVGWENAIAILRHNQERIDQREWDMHKSLRKIPQRGGEGERGLTRVDRRNIRQAMKKSPKEPPYERKGGPTWKEKLSQSKWWQNALEAKRLGITIDELIELRVNTEYE